MPSRPSVHAAFFGIAAVALGIAINAANGTLTPDAIEALNVSCGAVLLALVWPSGRCDDPLRGRKTGWLTLLLLLGIAWEVGLLIVTPPLLYGRFRSGDLPVFFREAAAAGVVSGALSFAPRAARRALIAALVIAHGAIGLWAIHASPEPHIDVFYFQRDSCAALLRGANPYTITFPNIYGDATPFYGPHVSVRGRLQFGFIYPPLSLFLSLPGYLLGDFRYSQLFAIEAAAVLMAFMRDGAIGSLAAALLLLSPRSIFVLEQGWTEPYVVLLLAATVFAACRAPRALPYALGLLLCVKQYLFLALAPSALLIPWRDARRTRMFVLKVALTAVVVTLPLALWNPRAFWFDNVGFQLQQPMRADALSYLVWFSRDRASPYPVWASFLVTGMVTALGLWRLPRTPAGFAAAIAAASLAFFATSKQAFANYYFFVIGAMCCTVAAQELRPPLASRVEQPSS
ncbi:MAG TPA: hypothetical protein VEK07_01375 [Polyangiaceae bacterium]|nr:hypothetical protein [Polyangiaceae bacterium]